LEKDFQQNFFCSSSAIACLDQSAMMSISEVAIEAQKLQVGMYFSNFSIIKGIIYVIVQIPFFPSIQQKIQQRRGAGGAVSGGQACLDPQKL
jgi:hypothetical protein